MHPLSQQGATRGFPDYILFFRSVIFFKPFNIRWSGCLLLLDWNSTPLNGNWGRFSVVRSSTKTEGLWLRYPRDCLGRLDILKPHTQCGAASERFLFLIILRLNWKLYSLVEQKTFDIASHQNCLYTRTEGLLAGRSQGWSEFRFPRWCVVLSAFCTV